MKNDNISWDLFDERLSQYEELCVNLFKTHCYKYHIPCQYNTVKYEQVPAFYPRLMKDFYSLFAPIDDILVGEYRFFSFDLMLRSAKITQDIIAIGKKGNQPVYIDKYPNGMWDLRIQTPIGNKKVVILEQNIFTFFGGFLPQYLEQ